MNRSRSRASSAASLRGRAAAYMLHATHDPKETTRKAREAFLQTFFVQVDPDGVLPAAERERRAEYARKAHFLRLALKSAEARRKRWWGGGIMKRSAWSRSLSSFVRSA